MEQPLRQITNQIKNKKQQTQQALSGEHFYKKSILSKEQQKMLKFPLKQFLDVSLMEINYGYCVPSTIIERTLTLTLKEDFQKPITFSMQIICEDQQLNSLSDFVYAIKKGKQFEFTDFYRFKLFKKGKYDFTISVKSPNLINYKVQSKLIIYSEFTYKNNHQSSYIINLIQQTYLPTIECSKLLQQNNNQNMDCNFDLKSSHKQLRVLKFIQLKSKPKKQIKIPFRIQENTKLTLVCDLLSTNQNQFQKGLIQIKPRQIALTGKGQFLITLKLNFLSNLVEYLQKIQKNSKSQKINSYIVRRILIMRIFQTDFHYHFPIQISFLLGNRKYLRSTE